MCRHTSKLKLNKVLRGCISLTHMRSQKQVRKKMSQKRTLLAETFQFGIKWHHSQQPSTYRRLLLRGLKNEGLQDAANKWKKVLSPFLPNTDNNQKNLSNQNNYQCDDTSVFKIPSPNPSVFTDSVNSRHHAHVRVGVNFTCTCAVITQSTGL